MSDIHRSADPSIYRQRLLNVARACREATNPNHFTMRSFMTACGTPGCALGNYAVRRDLQDVFYLRKRNQWLGIRQNHKDAQGFADPHVLEHFGIDEDEAEELFGPAGCNWAGTPDAAARYIETFVARKYTEVA